MDPSPTRSRSGRATGAAVDVGSNSVHLLVAAVGPDGLEPLADESVFLGLGAAVDEAAALGPALRAALATTLAGYATKARALGSAEPLLLGTEPLRLAADAAAAAAACRVASGLPLHILSGIEEALLTAIGVTDGRAVEGSTFIIDVGGGSTDLVLLDPVRPAVQTWTLAIGSGRLTSVVRPADPPRPDELALLRSLATEAVAAIPAVAPDAIVAVGGSAANLARVGGVAPGGSLDRAAIGATLTALLAEPAASFGDRHGLNPRRAPLLPAGGAILEAILDRCGRDRLTVSGASLREGAVLAWSHAGAGWRPGLQALARGWRDGPVAGGGRGSERGGG